ncbi:MAG: TIGR04255 family protein [Luteitalea sp.]|nr:TIGR04255 family protein [Luteitalea sp.]
MVAPQQLARPPITEALVDFRIIADQAIHLERLQPLRAELSDSFPKVDEKKGFQAEFRVEAGNLLPPVARDLGFQGVWLTSTDGNRIVQFRVDGFTFNNVGAYIGGETLLDEALRLWTRFAHIVRPAAVTRLALRYLNRLDLPLRDGEQLDRFLTAAPELPEGAPQRLSSFLSRVVAHDETDANVVVTQKLDTTGKFPVPIVIDVDAFFAKELDPNAQSLRGMLEILRALKNRVFFSLLTQEAVNLYI